MTYAELVAAVTSYCENQFDTTDMDTMIRLAEQQIYNAVQLPSLRKNVTGALTLGNKYLSAPTDFLSVFSLAVVLPTGEYRYLIDKDVNFLREAYPNPATTGTPKHYAIFGPRSDDATELSIIVGPTPSAALAVELHYYFYPESIVDAGQTWLGDNFDSALFNGVMCEAIRFMKGEQDLVALYDERYTVSLGLLKQLGDGKLRQDAYRSGQVRDKVA